VVRVSQSPLGEQPRLALVLAFILAVAAIVQCASYWPGIMTWDAITPPRTSVVLYVRGH